MRPAGIAALDYLSVVDAQRTDAVGATAADTAFPDQEVHQGSRGGQHRNEEKPGERDAPRRSPHDHADRDCGDHQQMCCRQDGGKMEMEVHAVL